MRVYISVDMEGVAGVVHEDQTNPTDPRCAAEYARFRKLMTAEANAAIQGALDAGATRVLVNDSQLNGRSVGELGLNAALAGVFGVPVVLVSGDAALASEAHDLLGEDVATVIVKEAVARHAARSLAPAVRIPRGVPGVAGDAEAGGGVVGLF